MTTRRWRPDSIPRPSRWLATAALLAVVPKCLLCLLAYAGLGAALGLGGPEICGAPAGGAGPGTWSLVLAGILLGMIGLISGLRAAVRWTHLLSSGLRS